MHGRIKVRTTEEQRLIKEKENQLKLQAYRLGVQQILASRNKENYDEKCLSKCSQLLILNPDIYTLWNYRKEVVLMQIRKHEELKATTDNKTQEIQDCDKTDTEKIEGAPESLEESENPEKSKTESDDKTKIREDGKRLIEFMENELKLTEHCLLQNPKSYSAWHHRSWILDHHPEPNWDNEFALCTAYLKKDDRNFHCWDYRRLIINKIGHSLEEELKFSEERINVNFSNYSSWHYRTTLGKFDKENVVKEISLVTNALYTDPFDSSAWFYLRWLLSNPNIPTEALYELMDALEQLQELEPTCKWSLLAKCWLTGSLRLNDKTCIDNRQKFYNELIKLDPMRKGHYEECLKR